MTTAEQPPPPGGTDPIEIGAEGAERARPDTARARPGNPQRDALVMMSFRSDDPFARRVQVLEFLRLKHLIQNVRLPRLRTDAGDDLVDDTSSRQDRIEYKVEVLQQRVGYYPEYALTRIAEADVLIGLLSQQSANVVFELATRHLLRDGLILLVDGAQEMIPIYFEGMIHIDYRTFRSPVVDQTIRRLAAQERPCSFRTAVPEELAKAVAEHERELLGVMTEALRQVERSQSRRPAYIRDLARFVSPSAIVESWDTSHPFCVIETWWKKMSGTGYYLHSDWDGGPWVTAGNQSFRDFYGIDCIPDPSSTRAALSGVGLLDRLEGMGALEPAQRRAFEADQGRIGEAIFFHQQNLSVRVPLVISGGHDDCRFRQKRFLPTIVGRTTIGSRHRPHKSYLTVLYVPLECAT